MNIQRPLHMTLAEFGSSLIAATANLPVHVTSIEMTLPIDLKLLGNGDLLGDLPLFRRRTDFDAEPSRLTVTMSEVAT